MKSFIGYCAVVFFLTGCVGEGDGSKRPVEASFDFQGMLANYADNLILPRYQRFATLNQSVQAAVTDYCGQIELDDELPSREAARQSWLSAMDQWQESELFLVGPAEYQSELRNRIYSFGSTFQHSSCGVDLAVIAFGETGFDFDSLLNSQTGLDAFEYLLFNENLAHTCKDGVITSEQWNLLPEAERKLKRCEYAQKVVEQVGVNVDELIHTWAFEGGDYRTEFINSSNLGASVKALSDALFYIELDTKDKKLGPPTGIKDCQRVACPDTVEHRYSQTSLTSIRTNLNTFLINLKGGEGLGFDDILIAKEAVYLLEEFDALTNKSIALIDSMDSSLFQQSTDLLNSGDRDACRNSAANPDDVGNGAVPICRLHGYLKQISDRLRIDFVTLVDLDIPDRGQGDND